MNLEELRARLGAPAPPADVMGQSGDRHPIERCVVGRVIDGPRGETFAVDSVRGPAQFHGRYHFQTLMDAGTLRLPNVVGANQLLSREVDLMGSAFIDTETTGLGYGVGTHVFMVGVGHLEGAAFRVRQFFLRHPGEEAAMLAQLADYLARFTTIISFNGRSFDWPLVENRFIYQRMLLRPIDPLHIDLLHLSRRLWRLRLESCGLASIERHILAVRRGRDDVEGWMIPQLYFQYLRTGNARPLRRVFYHNLEDILSLSMLAMHIHRVWSDPWSGLVTDPLDFLSLGRIHSRLGQSEMAIQCIQRALAEGLPARLEAEALLRLALINKRRGNWHDAMTLFGRVIDREGFERIACVELAKYHEHVAREHDQAMRFTVRALRSRDFADYVCWPGTRPMELHHRHRRLRQRLAGRVA